MRRFSCDGWSDSGKRKEGGGGGGGARSRGSLGGSRFEVHEVPIICIQKPMLERGQSFGELCLHLEDCSLEP